MSRNFATALCDLSSRLTSVDDGNVDVSLKCIDADELSNPVLELDPAVLSLYLVGVSSVQLHLPECRAYLLLASTAP